jgi:hypothetical protein
MVGQAQIAVGTQHQDLLALDDNLGVLRGRDCAKIGIHPRFPKLGGGLEVSGLFQQTGGLWGNCRLQAHYPMVNLKGGGWPWRRIGSRLTRQSFFQCRALLVVNHKQAGCYEAKSTKRLPCRFNLLTLGQQLDANSPSILIFSDTEQPYSRPSRPYSGLPITFSHSVGKH